MNKMDAIIACGTWVLFHDVPMKLTGREYEGWAELIDPYRGPMLADYAKVELMPCKFCEYCQWMVYKGVDTQICAHPFFDNTNYCQLETCVGIRDEQGGVCYISKPKEGKQ